VCHSTDPHDKRLRPSLLISRLGQNAVIDTSPDFRQQAMHVALDRLDAILLTHGHADHILGFDDIRPFNIRQRAALPVYSNEDTFRIIRRVFAYVFDDKPTLSTVPSVILKPVKGPFELLGIPFIPVPLLHGEMEVLGFRFGRAAYLTDFSVLPDSSTPLLQDLDELVLDALRDIPHPMHQTVEQALVLIERLKPRRAWFTHIAHDLPHAETNQRLLNMGYPHVQLAYDGLQFEVQVDAADEILRGHGDSKVSRTASGEVKSTRLSAFSSSQAWASRYAKFGHSSVLAIGNFDGIHLGHQAILRATVERAKVLNAVSTVLTFDPSPRKVLRPESAPPQLSTNAQRMEWFNILGRSRWTSPACHLRNLSSKFLSAICTSRPFWSAKISGSVTSRRAMRSCSRSLAQNMASMSLLFLRWSIAEKWSPAPSFAGKSPRAMCPMPRAFSAGLSLSPAK
jgi:phosphoribosyl 1,2-cyclic phosphate phosphodiesterase